MNEPKDLNYGFIIIVPENNPKLVEITVSSIKSKFNKRPFVCVVTSDISPENEKEISQFCPTYKAGNSYSSLINEGIKNSPSEWNLIIISGTSIRNRILRKYSCFVESEKDILFPIVDRKLNFIDGTVNGILIHRNAHQNLGDIPQMSTLQECKSVWAEKALRHGYKFKAVVGAGLV